MPTILLTLLLSLATCLMATGHFIYVLYSAYQCIAGLYLLWRYRHKTYQVIKFIYRYKTRVPRYWLRRTRRMFR